MARGVRTELHPSVALKAAAIVFYLSRNHSFIDGNKHVTWACMETYLDAQGLLLEINNDNAYELVGRIAQGDLEKHEIATYLEARLVNTAS